MAAPLAGPSAKLIVTAVPAGPGCRLSPVGELAHQPEAVARFDRHDGACAGVMPQRLGLSGPRAPASGAAGALPRR